MEKEVEVWKDVVGFEDKYLVSNIGRVYSKITKKILKQNLHVNGYFTLATKNRWKKWKGCLLQGTPFGCDSFLTEY